MADWSTFIQTGKYAGIAFDFVSVHDETARVVDRQKQPGRDGVHLVDRARDGRQWDILAVFVEDDYPDTYRELKKAIDDGGIREFIHPIDGKFKALVTRAGSDHNADDSTDSCTMQLHVEEHTEQTTGPTVTSTSVAARANALRNKALGILNLVSLFGAAIDALPNISKTLAATAESIAADATSAAALASDTADVLEQTGSDLSAIEVQANANAVLADIESVVSRISDCTFNGNAVPEQYDLLQGLTVTASATADLATAVSAGKPALTTFQVDADIPLLLWCHAKYGDSSRVDEVLALNPWIADPLLVPRGSTVTAYAE